LCFSQKNLTQTQRFLIVAISVDSSIKMLNFFCFN
jgi:hypothetical protein